MAAVITQPDIVTHDKVSRVYGILLAEHEHPNPNAVDDGRASKYKALDARLNALADTTDVTLKDIVSALAQMQALLSQRGATSNREQRRQYGYALISWSEYARRYAMRLGKSLRTIQRWVAGRDGSCKPIKKTKKKVGLRPAEQKALIQAQQAANEVVGAWDAGSDVASAVKAYKRVAVSPAKLDDYYGHAMATCTVPDCKCVCHIK
jgi:hypothetical protein